MKDERRLTGDAERVKAAGFANVSGCRTLVEGYSGRTRQPSNAMLSGFRNFIASSLSIVPSARIVALHPNS